MPLLWAVEISPVRAAASGRMALMRVDLPTPEWPDSRVMRPFSSSLQGVNAQSVFGRHFEAGIADGGVEVDEAVQIMQFVIVVDVYLVENDFYRHAVGFGRCQKAVDEGCAGFRIVDRNYQHALVQV